ncbi:DUF3883 domain-containing protein [Rubritalea tangerina]|uniref:DUF3883 domain-containing protein n=1 Tax=Rubritalea tangerina TaxID=430798 RepID=A0ABW4ZEB0_9BACT
MTPHPKISPKHFVSVLNHFTRKIEELDGAPFQSFAKGTPYKKEGYKHELFANAQRRLDVKNWKFEDLGTGKILDRVIYAIEIEHSAEQHGNNLLKWRQYGVHKRLIEIKGEETLNEFETLLYDFYRDELDGEDAFNYFIDLLKSKQYPLIAYLFFIKDCDKYLPISPERFDIGFQLLGTELKTSHRCSWENYNSFLTVITEVRDFLRAEGYSNTSLLDAHSFCWIIALDDFLPSEGEVGDANSSMNAPASIAEFIPTRNLQQTLPDSSRTTVLHKQRSSDLPIDWERKHKNNSLIGKLSEEIVLTAEKCRLRELGLTELAESVQLVSEENSLGYDILSYNEDGTERFIEVKTVTQQSDCHSFFTSWRQLATAEQTASYFYYLVHGPRSQSPKIEILDPSSIKEEWKSPINYLVTLPK